MLTNEIQDQIDNYLLNKMTMAEKANFEKQLLDNFELKEKLEIQRLIIDELQYRRDFERIVKHKQSTTLKIAASRIFLRKIMIVAWSAAAIFAGVFFVNQAFVNNRMDKGFTQNFSIPEVDVMRGDGTRGTDPEEVELMTAINYLENSNPKQAHEILLKLYQNSDESIYSEDIRWYLALTELKLHNKSKAKKYLEELIDSEYYGEKASKLLEEL